MPTGHWNKPREGGRVTQKSRPIRTAHPWEYPEGYVRRKLGHRAKKGDGRPYQHPAYVVHWTGSVLTVWDAQKQGEGRWEGRWMTQCSLHGKRMWHRSRRAAIESARSAACCRQCYDDAQRTAPCRICLAPRRGCPLCWGPGDLRRG